MGNFLTEGREGNEGRDFAARRPAVAGCGVLPFSKFGPTESCRQKVLETFKKL
jgi:hypothetical protein